MKTAIQTYEKQIFRISTFKTSRALIFFLMISYNSFGQIHEEFPFFNDSGVENEIVLSYPKVLMGASIHAEYGESSLKIEATFSSLEGLSAYADAYPFTGKSRHIIYIDHGDGAGAEYACFVYSDMVVLRGCLQETKGLYDIRLGLYEYVAEGASIVFYLPVELFEEEPTMMWVKDLGKESAHDSLEKRKKEMFVFSESCSENSKRKGTLKIEACAGCYVEWSETCFEIYISIPDYISLPKYKSQYSLFSMLYIDNMGDGAADYLLHVYSDVLTVLDSEYANSGHYNIELGSFESTYVDGLVKYSIPKDILQFSPNRVWFRN